MTTVTGFNFWTGDVVRDTITGELYKVTKLNPKNAKALDEQGRPWTIDQRRLTKATEAEKERFEAKTNTDPLADTFRIGHVVEFKNPSKPAMKGMFVVTKSKIDGYSLAYLGGNVQNRYWPTIPGTMLRRVDGSVTVTNV